jgi:hypothetical protein
VAVLGCVVAVVWWEEVKGVGIREVLFRSIVFTPPLVLFYYGDKHSLLVIGGSLNLIWVVGSLQTGVAARVLLLDFAFLYIYGYVAAFFLVMMFWWRSDAVSMVVMRGGEVVVKFGGGVVVRWWLAF